MSKRNKKPNNPADLWRKQVTLLVKKIKSLDKEIKRLGREMGDNALVSIEEKRAEKDKASRHLEYLKNLGTRQGYSGRSFPNPRSKGTKHPDLPYGGGYSDRGPEWLRNWR